MPGALTPLQVRRIADNDMPFVAAFLAANFRSLQNTPAVAVPITASPMTYTNSSIFVQQVVISGGTVSQIAGSNSGVTGETAGVYLLRPGDSITVTYTVAPTNFSACNFY